MPSTRAQRHSGSSPFGPGQSAPSIPYGISGSPGPKRITNSGIFVCLQLMIGVSDDKDYGMVRPRRYRDSFNPIPPQETSNRFGSAFPRLFSNRGRFPRLLSSARANSDIQFVILKGLQFGQRRKVVWPDEFHAFEPEIGFHDYA